MTITRKIKDNNKTKTSEFTHILPLSTILVCVAFTNTLQVHSTKCRLKKKNIPAIKLELKAMNSGYFQSVYNKKREQNTSKENKTPLGLSVTENLFVHNKTQQGTVQDATDIQKKMP